MTEILLIRHGETAWNTGEVFRGRADIGLSETGILQAKLLADYLKDTPVKAVYASPLERAVKTAEDIARTHRLKVRIDEGLIDIDYGEWQGMSRKEVNRIYKKLYIKWANTPESVLMPGGESLDTVRERVTGAVERIIDRHSGSIVIVTHRVVLKVLICALLGLDSSHFWNIRQDTCGITRFTREDGRYTLVSHNDTSFQKSVPGKGLADF